MKQDHGKEALEDWDNEGGSQIASLAAAFAIEEFEESERRILAFLGASVLSLWTDLPVTERQRVLNRELAKGAFNKSLIKERLTRLLGSTDFGSVIDLEP